MSSLPSACTFNDLFAVFSLVANAGTVGFVAVPLKSPANCNLPAARVVASGTPVVAICETTWST